MDLSLGVNLNRIELQNRVQLLVSLRVKDTLQILQIVVKLKYSLQTTEEFDL